MDPRLQGMNFGTEWWQKVQKITELAGWEWFYKTLPTVMFLLATWLFRSHLVFSRLSNGFYFSVVLGGELLCARIRRKAISDTGVGHWDIGTIEFRCWKVNFRKGIIAGFECSDNFEAHYFLTWLVVPKITILVECVLRAQMYWFGISATGMFKFTLLSALLRHLGHEKNGESTLVLVMLVISTCVFEGEISPWSTTIPLRRNVEFSNGGNLEIARCTLLQITKAQVSQSPSWVFSFRRFRGLSFPMPDLSQIGGGGRFFHTLLQ